MKRNYYFIALLAVCLMAQAAHAGYVQVLTFEQVNAGGASTAHNGTLIDGTTAYNFMANNDAGRITKTINVDGTPTTTELMSTATWTAASGKTNLSGWYGYGFSGDYIQFAETGSDAIWRVDKTTGVVTSYVTDTQIYTHTGQASAQILSPHTVGPDGEHYFYEGKSDSILRTNGLGVVETYIGDTQLTAVAGNDSVGGGITFDGGGNLIWGSNSSDAIYSWNGASGSTLLTTANITDVTGGTAAGFGDIFYAPDGNVYFYDTSSDGILSFNPSDAANTLDFVLTEAELLAGPGASDSVGQLEWYDGNIGWCHVSASALKGFYATPEPNVIILLLTSLLGLALGRRRMAR
jgi:hypothetical protein